MLVIPRRIHWYVPLTVISLISCSRRPAATTPPVFNTSPRVIPDSTPGSHNTLFAVYQPGNMTYDYRLTSVVQVTTGDSIPRADSTRLTAILTASYSGDQLTTVMIRADSIRLVSGTRQAGSVQTEFATSQLDRKSGRLLTSTLPTLDCTLTTTNLIFRGDEVTPVIPEVALTATSWTDSSSYELCRGGVRLLVNKKTQHHVDEATMISGQRRIVRSTELRLAGNGIQWQQPVQITGTGSAIDTVTIGGSPTRIQIIAGTGQLKLDFTSALRRQTFIQSTSVSIINRNR